MPDIINLALPQSYPWYPGLIRTHSELIRRESSFREKGNHALSQKDLGPGEKKRVCARLAHPDRAPRRQR